VAIQTELATYHVEDIIAADGIQPKIRKDAIVILNRKSLYYINNIRLLLGTLYVCDICDVDTDWEERLIAEEKWIVKGSSQF
jgi:hypothetical protein